MSLRSAEDDLAFLRGLVDGDPNAGAAFGQAYFTAGLIYGAQVLVQWADLTGIVHVPETLALAIYAGFTLAFLAALTVILLRHRGVRVGPSARAINSAFAVIGLANLVLLLAIGAISLRENSKTIFLLYPIIVFVLQGAAWAFSYALRKRVWRALVAFGWFAAALAMAMTLGAPTYVAVAGASLLLLMALPGYLMARAPTR